MSQIYKKQRRVQTCFYKSVKTNSLWLYHCLSWILVTLFACMLGFFLPWSVVFTCHGGVFNCYLNVIMNEPVEEAKEPVFVGDCAPYGVVPNQYPCLCSFLLISGARDCSPCFHQAPSLLFWHISMIIWTLSYFYSSKETWLFLVKNGIRH